MELEEAYCLRALYLHNMDQSLCCLQYILQFHSSVYCTCVNVPPIIVEFEGIYQFFDLNHSVVNFFCDISFKLQLDMGTNQKNGVFS